MRAARDEINILVIATTRLFRGEVASSLALCRSTFISFFTSSRPRAATSASVRDGTSTISLTRSSRISEQTSRTTVLRVFCGHDCHSQQISRSSTSPESSIVASRPGSRPLKDWRAVRERCVSFLQGRPGRRENEKKRPEVRPGKNRQNGTTRLLGLLHR